MEFILNLFGKWGFFALFFVILLEYACFPIPSEIVLPFAGFVASSNGYSLIGVILLSTIMGYMGCLICYLIGYYGGKRIYNKIYEKKVKWRKGLDSASNMFSKYGNVSVLGGRIIPLCRTYISFLAGIFHQDLFKYSLFSILGILIWNSILIGVGYILKDNFGLVSSYYDKYKIILFVIVGLFLILFLLNKCIKRINKQKI